MSTYKIPGVYIEEIPQTPPSVVDAPSAVPAFIGHTERATLHVSGDLYYVPTQIGSLAEYELSFGSGPLESFTVDLIEDAATGTFVVGNPRRVAPPVSYRLYDGLRLFFANGGGPCYVISVGDYCVAPVKGDAAHGLLGGLAAAAHLAEPTLLAIPDAVNLTKDDFFAVMNATLEQCRTLHDRFAIMDLFQDDADIFRQNISNDLSLCSYGAAYHPWLETTFSFRYNEDGVSISKHTMSDGALPAAAESLTGKSVSTPAIKVQNALLYDQIQRGVGSLHITMPPSCAIAGVIVKVDRERGVWKAPANIALNNVIKPTIALSKDDQDVLNGNPFGDKSVNSIRTFPGKGALVWGGRTVAGNDHEWRYISVRRLFMAVEKSLKKSTEWVVFEPNASDTWVKVTAMISNYLTLKWSEGALIGAKPENAFFVNCGLGTTMYAQDILEGRMIIEVGMAAVCPAEFIIFRISHTMPKS